MRPEKKDSSITKRRYNPTALFITATILVCTVLFLTLRCETAEKSPSATDADIMAKSDSLNRHHLIHRIQQCSRLYTMEYQVHKIVTHEDAKVLRLGNLSMEIPMTDRRIAIPIDATLKAYIDLAQFTERNISDQGDHIVILLPDPRIEVTSTIVDHDGTLSHVSLVRHNYTAREQESFHRQGVLSITAGLLESDMLEQARLSAARLIVPILTQMGYREEDVEVRFAKDKFSVKDLPQLIDSKTVKFNTKP